MPSRHRFPLSDRDVQELLQARGIEVSHDTLRRWHVDEACTTIGGVRHWLWRAVDERGVTLDVL